MTARDLDIKLKDLAERIGDECKSLRRLINSNSNNLNDLDTSSKESLVSAINELNSFNLNLNINSLGGITEQEVDRKLEDTVGNNNIDFLANYILSKNN